ncbi:transposase [Flavobacterium silvaticum]|uniref:Transposase n=1 Tax=Flavobacterium silvaticum TaxID=1852020 RepID=A0A972FKZ3_9FLAO|nr:transposase [Flavobacterium silvaticum]NMH27663.1 transposase [Flavobacterium silvaticum]
MKKQLPYFESETECKNYLEALRWPNGVISPFDEYSKIYLCKGEKFRCRNTGKYFNVRTGTLFSNSRLSLNNWTDLLNQAWQGNIDVKWIAEQYNLSLKSAYLIHQKLLSVIEMEKTEQPTAEQFTLADWLFQIKN